MIFIIGGRYFIFSSIYGMRVYWVFGTVLILSGVVGFLFNSPFHVIGLTGGIIEILFYFIILSIEKEE